jgi:hypothetical protein
MPVKTRTSNVSIDRRIRSGDRASECEFVISRANPLESSLGKEKNQTIEKFLPRVRRAQSTGSLGEIGSIDGHVSRRARVQADADDGRQKVEEV